MKALGVGTVLNIILDPIFIYYLEKIDRGIEGAALATVLSQFIVCIILIYYLIYKKRSYINFSLKYLKFNPVVIKEILKIGIPSSLSMVIMAMGAFVFNLILNSDDAVAAFNIGSRIEHLFFLPIISISSSLVTLVGMFYGANRIDLIRSIIRYGLKFSLTFSCFCLLFFFFISKYIIPFFTSSENIAQISIGYFSIVSFSYPFVTIGMTSSRIMQGLGKGIPVLFITLVRVILINAPLGWYLRRVLEMPIEFVWYCILFSSFVAATLSMLWMKNIIKQKENQATSVT
jgi:putative MATE family efflux protein